MSDLNIIVVDDEPGLRGMIEDYLSMQGFSVASAENGAALDRLLATHNPDMLLMDVNMPGEDGISIVKRLRHAGERMGIIVLTANAEESSKVDGLSYGADDYLTKPFEVRELLARVRSLQRRLPPRQEKPSSSAARSCSSPQFFAASTRSSSSVKSSGTTRTSAESAGFSVGSN